MNFLNNKIKKLLWFFTELNFLCDKVHKVGGKPGRDFFQNAAEYFPGFV